MKRPRLLLLPMLLTLPLLWAGCETINHRDREVLREHNVPPDVFDRMLYGDPLSPDDVIALSRRAVPPGLIIHYMDETDTVYRLRKTDVKELREAGVSEEVISYMLTTGRPYGPGPYPPYPYGPGVYAGGYGYPGPYGFPYPYGPYYYGYPGPILFVGGGYGRWDHGRWDHGHR